VGMQKLLFHLLRSIKVSNRHLLMKAKINWAGLVEIIILRACPNFGDISN
jgi:hypothetical protein